MSGPPEIAMIKRSVLVIEDQQDIAQLVHLHLKDLDCQIKLAFDGPSGFAEAQAKHYDLIILDLMLPGLDGLEICRRLRAGANYTPILMLTSKSSELDRVLGLETGADDYLTKPFSVLELVARVKAIFRRIDAISTREVRDKQLLSGGELAIDVERRVVRLRGRAVDLTAREFDLLLHLAQNPGRVYTRNQLLDQVWGYSHSGYEHTVNSHMNRLRAKIEDDPAHPKYVLTVWGVGYKFAELPAEPPA
jgi:DNA-binding response OmpR family regulator